MSPLSRQVVRASFRYSKILCRSYCLFSNSRIGEPIKTSEDLDRLLESTKYSINDLFSFNEDESQISIENSTTFKELEQKLPKLMKLSGFSEPSDETEKKHLVQILYNQLQFLNQIHNVNTDDIDKPLNRLVPDPSPLSFDEIAESDTKNAMGLDAIKWDPIKLASEHEANNYIVKEGLIKNEN